MCNRSSVKQSSLLRRLCTKMSKSALMSKSEKLQGSIDLLVLKFFPEDQASMAMPSRRPSGKSQKKCCALKMARFTRRCTEWRRRLDSGQMDRQGYGWSKPSLRTDGCRKETTGC